MATFKYQTPFCHLTFGPAVVIVKDGEVVDSYDPPPHLCRGSNCSAWVKDSPTLGRCGLVENAPSREDPVPQRQGD
jgi:hypothetical protein